MSTEKCNKVSVVSYELAVRASVTDVTGRGAAWY